MRLGWAITGLLLSMACGSESQGTGSGEGSTGNATTMDTTGASSETGNETDLVDSSSGSGSGSGSGPGERYHPVGFAEAGVHGLAAKLNTENCLSCHGPDLQGGPGSTVSCDSCHEAGWRTDCVYCHGGDETNGGAPPRDIDGMSEAVGLAFRAHTAHVTETNHPAFACSMCHVEPENVLSAGHLWDDTPAVSELDFSTGISPDTIWSAGICGNLYCHGNGNGQVGGYDHANEAPTCSGCHADETTPVDWLGMSGEHGRHLLDSVACSDCHATTTTGPGVISTPMLHVNGVPDVAFVEATITYDEGAATCDGLCHLEIHTNEGW